LLYLLALSYVSLFLTLGRSRARAEP